MFASKIQTPLSNAYEQAADTPVKTVPLVVAAGEGIGPEITRAVLAILDHAGAKIDAHMIDVGASVYAKGVQTGIDQAGIEAITERGLLLKGPIGTPQGKGMKSVNVTLRKTLGLFANVRPVRAYAPFVATKHPAIDMVILRENEEDTYAGIEHRQSQDVVQCLKLFSRPGTERFIRYSFEYLNAVGIDRVTCMTKDNIMKMTDGLFREVFEEVGRSYPHIKQSHEIIDAGMAHLANRPENYKAIIMPNLYGDIGSDVAAEIAGSVGMGGSANIGQGQAMFEAIHGTAPDIAGQDKANPSGMLSAAILMLRYTGQGVIAERIENAWLKTIEDGFHTGDIASRAHTKNLVGTRAFAAAIIDRLGQVPVHLAPAQSGANTGLDVAPARFAPQPRAAQSKQLVGVDVFLDQGTMTGPQIDTLAAQLDRISHGLGLSLAMISSRGTAVWPQGTPHTFTVDHWRCRFEQTQGQQTNPAKIAELLLLMARAGLPAIKTENLYQFDGKAGYTLGQGQRRAPG